MTEVKTECKNNVLKRIGKFQLQGAGSRVVLFIFFFFFLKILFIRERRRERPRPRQREKQAPCREPDAGLDPGTPGLHPGPKAGTEPLSPPGIPLLPS